MDRKKLIPDVKFADDMRQKLAKYCESQDRAELVAYIEELENHAALYLYEKQIFSNWSSNKNIRDALNALVAASEILEDPDPFMEGALEHYHEEGWIGVEQDVKAINQPLGRIVGAAKRALDDVRTDHRRANLPLRKLIIRVQHTGLQRSERVTAAVRSLLSELDPNHLRYTTDRALSAFVYRTRRTISKEEP